MMKALVRNITLKFMPFALFTCLSTLAFQMDPVRAQQTPVDMEALEDEKKDVPSRDREEANKIIQAIFVDKAVSDSAQQLYYLGGKKREESDSLWSIFDQDSANAVTLSLEEKARFSELLMKAGETIEKKIRYSKLSYQEKGRLIRSHEQARDYLLEAARLNPLDSNIKKLLVSTLERLARLHESKNELVEANQILYDVLEGSPGRFSSHYYLGRNYYKLQQYDKALEHLTIAEDIILNDSFFDAFSHSKKPIAYEPLRLTETKKNYLFSCLSWRYQCERSLGLTDNSICTLFRILTIAPEEKKDDYISILERISRYGNVDNMQALNQFRKLIRGENYEEARAVGLSLIDQLSGKPAYVDIVAEVAMLEFNRLNEQEIGYQRLAPIVDKIMELGPQNENERRLLNTFGSFCQSIANNYEETDSKKAVEKAVEYYVKGSEFPWEYSNDGTMWSGQAYCFYKLAYLSSINSKLCQEYSEKALEYEIDPRFKAHLLNLLIDSLRKNYRRVEAEERFKDLQEFLRMQKTTQRTETTDQESEVDEID